MCDGFLVLLPKQIISDGVAVNPEIYGHDVIRLDHKDVLI